jgi:alginate O-acetyltransferase complex protein AlgI
MLFNSAEYGIFLGIVFALYWLLRDSRGSRFLLLLAASWFFYASWNWKLLSLILISTAIDYWVGGALAKTDAGDPAQRGKRKRLLLLSLCSNLGLLAIFKYLGFFLKNIQELAGQGSLDGFLGFFDRVFGIDMLEIVLPVGISFYTFQTLSYTIDIYRGSFEPASLKDLALFVGVLPAAGGRPDRARERVPAAARTARSGADAHRRGRLRPGLIFIGLTKKADARGRARPCSSWTVSSPEATSAGGWTALLGICGYALQIYGDFSGYSDMAIGCARLLGFRLPKNFNFALRRDGQPTSGAAGTSPCRPGCATTSTSRSAATAWGRAHLQVNLALTMLLGGLWHGASWNMFVVWGALHGLWLVHRSLVGAAWAARAR